jgi:hypothetical protein
MTPRLSRALVLQKVSMTLAALTLAACSSAGSPATSESEVHQASMRAFGEDDVSALLLQDGDAPGVTASHDGPAGPTEELPDAEWTEHVQEHGLKGRWWSGLTSGEEVPLGYPFIIGARVSLWADAEAAGEALTFENSTPRPGTRILVSRDVRELGDEGACAIVDWGELSDRAWCRFAVANATFDVYVRTGERLDPRAPDDLVGIAVRLRQRAESLAMADPVAGD